MARQRITRAFVEARVDTVNRLLGFEAPVEFSTVGAVYLYGAYGDWAVHQWTNEAGGIRTLHELGSHREASIFLGGMIAALREVQVREIAAEEAARRAAL